ncbi:hypothetical protein [Ornithinibacillus xuwenensis]|uniref:Phage protein n=1 Tax=Ornithinibacillus xuwenensis TaxID=3144668 RepID=A0ABU9XBW2_9BACI
MKEYAVYKGDEFLCLGTAIECADKLGVKADTIVYYTSPAYQRKLAKRNAVNPIIVIKLEDE